MKVRSKSGLLAVLLSILCAVTLIAGIWLALPAQMSHADETAETGLVPIYGAELASNPSGQQHDTNGGDGTAVFWDALHTQMRIHFKYVGDSAPERPDKGKLGKCVKELGNYILLTKDGETRSVVEWSWGWYSPATTSSAANGTYEIWINAGPENLEAVTEVTILAGLTWQNTESTGETPQEYSATPVAGMTVHKNYTLRVNETKDNYELVSDNEPVGVVPLTDDAFKQAYIGTNPTGQKNTIWDGTQMRLYFRLSGCELPANFNSSHMLDNERYILVTTPDGTKSVAEWNQLGKIALADFQGHGEANDANRRSAYEIWLNCNNSKLEDGSDFLTSISQITIKAGFRWRLSDGNYLADAVAPKTFVMSKTDSGWHLESTADDPIPEVGLYPVYGEELAASRASTAGIAPAYWSDNQMRLFFKFEGIKLPARQATAPTLWSGDMNKVKITTTSGETKTVPQWISQSGGGWFSEMSAASVIPDVGPYDSNLYEIWACDNNAGWVVNAEKVTIEAGFQWYEGSNPIPGAVLHKTYTIKLDKSSEKPTWVLDQITEPVEANVTPIAGEDIQNGPFTLNGAGKKAALWDGTQMRLYFKLEGISAPDDTAGQNVYGQNENIILTLEDGTSGTLKDWSGKLSWTDNRRHGLDDDRSYHEIWLCAQDEAWLASIKYVTIKAGFQLQAGTVPLEGATIKETVYLQKDENGNWAFCTAQDIPKPQIELSVLTQAEAKGHFNGSGDSHEEYTGKYGSYWSPTTLRIYFHAKGANLTGALAGSQVYNQSDKIVITDSTGKPQTVAELTVATGPLTWVDFWQHGGGTDGYGEIAICVKEDLTDPTVAEKNIAWLAGIKTVTFKEGFEWLTAANTPLEGTALKADVTIWNAGIEKGWQRYADSITATLNEGEVNQGDKLEDHLTVKAKYGEEEEVITDYTLEGYDSTKTGEAQTVTVKYQDRTTTVSVTVKAADKALTDIELSGKTTFDVKRFEELDLTGLVVTANFDNGDEERLEKGDYEVDPFDPWTTEKVVTLKVSYEFAGKTCEQNITVNVGEPDKTTGLRVATDNSILWPGPGHIGLYFTFDGIAAPEKFGNACYLDGFAGNHIAEYIVIKLKDGSEQTYSQWKEGHSGWIFASEDKGAGNGAAKLVINLLGDEKQTEQTLAEIQAITVKAGLQWVGIQNGKPGSGWGAGPGGWTEADYNNYQNWPGAIVKEDVTLWKGAENWEKYAASIDVTTTQESLAINEEVDISRIKLTVHYQDGTQTEVLVTKEMLDRTSFAEAGESQKITVTYQDKTDELSFTVTAKELTGIEIATQPTVKSYNFGALTLNLEGLAVNKVFKDNSKVALTADEIKTLEVTGFDGYTPGEQEITVKYGELTAKFKVTVKEPSETDGMYIDWQQNAPYDAAKQVSGVTITFVSRKGGATPKTTKVSKNADHLLDYVEINGKPAKQYVESGAIDWVGFYGWEFTIALKNSSLVWSTRAEGSENKDCVYEPGVSEVIKTVKILKGFQLYESKDGADHWLDSDEAGYEKKKEGAVLTEDVYLYNNDGFSWERILKQDTGANVLEDNFKPVANALAITTPAEKLTYKKGEALSVRGLVLTALFEDGGTETITITANDVKGYKKDQVGRQTLTIEVLHGTITYEVEVTDQSGTDQPGTDQPGTDQPGTDQPGTDQPGADQPGKDEGGCGSVIGMNALLLMGGACAVVLFRRKRK